MLIKVLHVAQLCPQQTLNVCCNLLKVIQVVVHPLMQQIGDTEIAYVRVSSASVEILRCELRYKVSAGGAHCSELFQKADQPFTAVLAYSNRFVLIGDGQDRFFAIEHDADTINEIDLVFLDQVTDDFFDAPRARTRVPDRGGEWHGAQKLLQGDRRASEKTTQLQQIKRSGDVCPRRRERGAVSPCHSSSSMYSVRATGFAR